MNRTLIINQAKAQLYKFLHTSSLTASKYVQLFTVIFSIMLMLHAQPAWSFCAHTSTCTAVTALDGSNQQQLPKANMPWNTYPQNVFRSPLDIPLLLSGTFGELRNNHFHAGLDIKTQGTENLNIFAVADGYVSRIRTAPGGYGNVVYITHYNGFTSVYAHLNKFNYAIQNYLKEQQYAQQNFDVDIEVAPGILSVTKGQVIAKSGNTGSSGGPHLHFEIRDTYTEEAINPLLFGFDVKDSVSPLIQTLGIYPLITNGTYGNPKLYTAKKVGNDYKTNHNIITVSHPLVGVGIKTYDKLNGASNLNGVYSVAVRASDQEIYKFEMERIAFHETRYLNSHCDYRYKKKGRGWMNKCFKDPTNQLSIYTTNKQNGHIDLSDGRVQLVNIEVKDAYGNSSMLSVQLQYKSDISGKSTFTPLNAMPKSVNAYFKPHQANEYNDEGIQLQFPENAFYRPIQFSYSQKQPTAEQAKAVFSAYHTLHDVYTPVHKYFDIAITPQNLPPDLYDKAIIAYKVGTWVRTRPSTWQNGRLTATSRDFGTYYITTDTKPPSIKSINVSNGKNMKNNTTLTFNIHDALSGIQTYNGYIDGRWVLFEYDKKTGRLRHYFDERTPKGSGQHTLELRVTDGVGNEKVYNAKFIR